MKKNRFYVGAAILGIVALTMTGCQNVPQEKMEAANQSVREAQAAGAAIYAAESYIKLQDSLSAALETVEKEKSVFFKNFDGSTVKLDGVIAYADEVKKEAEAQKTTLETEVSTTISDIKVLLEENRQLITEAPKGKEGTEALVAIKGELETIATTVNESEQMMKEGDLMVSKEKAVAAKDKAIAINMELKTVISKYKLASR